MKVIYKAYIYIYIIIYIPALLGAVSASAGVPRAAMAPVLLLLFVACAVLLATHRALAGPHCAREAGQCATTFRAISLGLAGPILRAICRRALPAQRAGGSRVRLRRAQRREQRMWWRAARRRVFFEHVSLLGGGSRPGRGRVQTTRGPDLVRDLAAQVQELAEQVAQLQQPRLVRRRRRRRQARRSRPALALDRPSPVAEGTQPQTPGLLAALLQGLAAWQAAPHTVSEQDIDSTLRRLLAEHTPPTGKRTYAQVAANTAAKPPAGPERPVSGNPNPLPNKLQGKPPKPSPPVGRLHAAAWSVPVVPPTALLQHALCTNVVVPCVDAHAVEDARNALSARGFQHAATLVQLTGSELPDRVLVQGPQGPRPAPAKLHCVGSKALPSQFQDDSALPSTPSPTCLLRLTLATEFAVVSAKPATMPASLLGDARCLVVQTRAAVAYETEVTCLVQVRSSSLEQLLGVALPTGACLNRHRADAVPQWVERATGSTSAAYWSEVHKLQTEHGGRVVYHPGRLSGCPALGCCVPSAFPLLPLLLGCSMAARLIGLKRTCWAGLPAVDLRALPLLTGEGVGLGLSAPARRQAPMMSVRPSPLLLASLLPWLAGVLPLPHLLPLPRRAGALLRLLTWFPFLLPRLRRLLILLNLTPTRTMMSVWATLASKPAMAPLPSVPGRSSR